MDVSQGTPISIQLKTVVDQAGEKKNFFFDVVGQMVKINDKLYIRYKEMQEDGSEVPVTIKIEPDGQLQLMRSGETRMRLRFAYQTHMETAYQTPYGTFNFSTFTRNLHVSLKDQPTSGSIMLDYELHSPGEKIGDYHLELEFTA